MLSRVQWGSGYHVSCANPPVDPSKVIRLTLAYPASTGMSPCAFWAALQSSS
jgi:hypothetical protein